MRLLLDTHVFIGAVTANRRLKSSARELLPRADAVYVEAAWSGVKNGKLLALASADFDEFVTVDKKLPIQPNRATSHCVGRARLRIQ
jgi:hypothetical protein